MCQIFCYALMILKLRRNMVNFFRWDWIASVSTLLLIFSSAAFAEKGNTHGQTGGSFRLNVNGEPRAILGYYLQDPDHLEIIENWIIDPENSTLLQNSISIYDAFILTVHADSIFGGLINSKFTGFMTEADIISVNRDLDDLAIKKDGCLLLPMAFGGREKGRANVIQFFVYDNDLDQQVSQGEIDACLDAGFGLAKQASQP